MLMDRLRRAHAHPSARTVTLMDMLDIHVHTHINVFFSPSSTGFLQRPLLRCASRRLLRSTSMDLGHQTCTEEDTRAEDGVGSE